MGKNSGGQDTHFRSADGQSEIKIILDKQTEQKIAQLTEKCEKGATDKEVIEDLKDLIHSVVDKNTPKAREAEKSNVAQIPLQISDEDYKGLISSIKKSQDANRGNPDKSRQFTKQILSNFITTKARDNVQLRIARKQINTQVRQFGRLEKMMDSMSFDQAEREFKRISGYFINRQNKLLLKLLPKTKNLMNSIGRHGKQDLDALRKKRQEVRGGRQ